MIIKQKNYGNIEVDNSEKDIVQIINNESDPQIISIERDKIDELIKALEHCKNDRS